MKRILWILLFAWFDSGAVNFPALQGPVSFGAARISSVLKDPFAAYNHQGCLALVKNDMFSLSAKNSYFSPELNTYGIAVCKKINKTQVLGLGYGFFGNKYYNESLLKLSFAKKLFEKTGAGISLDYFRLQLPKETFDIKNILTFEIGLYTELNKNFDIAIQLINPAMVQLSKTYNEKLAFVANSSIFYKVDNKLKLGAEWSQTVNGKGYSKFCINYEISPKFDFYCGFYKKPSNASVGIICNYKKLKISLAFSTHPYLKSSSAAGITFY